MRIGEEGPGDYLAGCVEWPIVYKVSYGKVLRSLGKFQNEDKNS
jgi:hypothetical protein